MSKVRTRDGLAELQSAVWIVHASLDPLEILAGCGHSAQPQHEFALRLRGGVRGAPIEARFRFVSDGLRKGGLAFTWTHDDEAPLPSMTGMISFRRIGPLLILSVQARYACGLDVPERLFFEAVGRKLADKTFAGLRRALVYLLQHHPSRCTHEG
ncbi:MAG TPA: hypothetical protein VMV65_01175 [Alphaproteobacteria bacterium]|nr:hypothetical protein [Alphaproteobacteria bacterium]